MDDPPFIHTFHLCIETERFQSVAIELDALSEPLRIHDTLDIFADPHEALRLNLVIRTDHLAIFRDGGEEIHLNGIPLPVLRDEDLWRSLRKVIATPCKDQIVITNQSRQALRIEDRIKHTIQTLEPDGELEIPYSYVNGSPHRLYIADHGIRL